MNILKLFVLATFLFWNPTLSFATDGDDANKHEEGEHKDEHAKEEKHVHAKNSEKHDDEDEHGEEHEEESSAVGPNRGITSIGHDGFTLAPEAAQSFTIKTVDYTGGSLTLPKASIVNVKEDVSIFRLRDNQYKRIPVRVLKKGDKETVIESSELKSSDKVVTQGAAFLRIAEVAATGGISHSH